MKPTDLLLILLPLWIITRFWIQPLLKERWTAVDLKSKIAQSGALVVVEKIRELSAIAVVAILLLMGLVWLNSLLGDSDVVVADGVLDTLESLMAIVSSVKNQHGLFLTWFGLIGAGICLYMIGKRAKQRLTNAWLEKTHEVREKFNKDFTFLENLATDSQLAPGVARAKEIITILTSLDNQIKDDLLDDQQLEALHLELEYLLLTLAMEKAKSEVNIEEALKQPAQTEQIQNLSPFKRILRVLASNQFAKDLGLINRPLSYIATILLLVSLSGWAAVPLANSLQLSVNNLRIHAIQEDVSRQLNQAISEISQEDTESVSNDNNTSAAQNARQVAQLSRILAKEAANQLLQSQSIGKDQRQPISKSEFVRANILNQAYGVDTQTNAAQQVRFEVAEQVANPDQHSNKLTMLVDDLEREIKPDLEKIQRSNPTHFGNLFQKIEARYSTSINVFDAQSHLISQVINQAFGQIDTGSPNELMKQGRTILKDVGKNSVKIWANSYAKAVVADALFDQSRGGVVDKLNQGFKFKTSPPTEQILDNLTLAENSGWRLPPTELKEREISKNLANTIAQRYNDDTVKSEIRQRLGGYSNLFPDATAASIDFGDGFAGGVGSPTSAKTESKAHMGSRSTNFKLASRSFRVRGVLIGQEISGKKLDITDIQWKLTPKSDISPTIVSISLKINGKWKHIGDFPAAIVNQGMRYAADRRVVATTITPGDEEVINRVTYLHPVLADTPLGCRIVEADRFVDTFTSTHYKGIDPRLKSISDERSAIAKFMAFSNLSEMVGQANQHDQCPLEELGGIVRKSQIGNLGLSPKFLAQLENFLRLEIGKPLGSDKLIQVSLECANKPLSETSSCLCSNLSYGMSKPYWFPEDHTSQFREKPVKLTEDFQWLTPSKDRFKHIELWLHTTFALRTPSSDGESTSDETTATPMDFDNEQLTTLTEVIVSDLLAPYLTTELNSLSFEDFMAPLEQFIIIQRVMRAALNGQLGENFPLGKLIALSRETQMFVPTQPTIRWEPHLGSEQELLEVLANTDRQALQQYNAAKNDKILRYQTKQPICGTISL